MISNDDLYIMKLKARLSYYNTKAELCPKEKIQKEYLLRELKSLEAGDNETMQTHEDVRDKK